MTKNILLAASALGVIAFAGAATATEITTAKVSGVNITPSAPYVLANEALAGTSNANIKTTTASGDNQIASALSGTTRFDPGINGTNYAATLTLTGATFSNAVSNANVIVTGQSGGCTIATPNIVSGGGAGQNFVTLVFNVGTSCTVGSSPTAPNGVTFNDVAFTLDALTTTAVSAKVEYKVATTESVYNGPAATANLVTRGALYTVSASASPLSATALPTQVALGTTTPAYTALKTGSGFDATIGSIKAATSSTVRPTLLGATVAAPALTYTATIAGDYAIVKPHVSLADDTTAASPDFVVATGNGSASLASSSGNRSIFVTIGSGNTTSVTSPISSVLGVNFALGTTGVVTAPTNLSNVALETVTQEGTNFVAPWFPLNNTNNIGTLRISNGSTTTATGPITIVQSSTGATCSVGQTQLTGDSSTLVGGGIPARGAVLVTGPALATCFGNTAQNSDIRVIIQSLSTELTAKVRIRNAATNATYESDLGRLGDLGVAY